MSQINRSSLIIKNPRNCAYEAYTMYTYDSLLDVSVVRRHNQGVAPKTYTVYNLMKPLLTHKYKVK
jgi:hypothetical protein